MPVLVTGAAGFIGFHVTAELVARGDEVVGVDDLNNYYSAALKEARLARLAALPGFQFRRLDIAERGGIEALFAERRDIDRVVHLAAQAGVRYSLENPRAYIRSNVVGQAEILEACRGAKNLKHLVFASSSSVY